MNLPNNQNTNGFGNAGWVCGSCGSWVQNGTSHICNWPNRLPQSPQLPTSGFITTVPVDNSYAILTELREIKELLKLEGKRKNAELQ